MIIKNLENKIKLAGILSIGCFATSIVISGTVSYTHLDVYKRQQQDALKCILKVRMYFNLRHVSASAMLTKVELPKR